MDDVAELLRARRSELVEQFELINSPIRLLEFQETLVREIKAVEAAAFRDRRSPEREHLQVLRLMGDAVAWTTLHSHTLRQLAKHPGKPPALGSQGPGFDFVLQCARLAADSGWPVRICDVTNVLRIGDLVIGDSDRPMLIECGPDTPTRFEDRGRKGRQKALMDAVSLVLNEGRGHIPGDTLPFVVHETRVEMQYSWQAVEEATRAALTDGEGIAGGDGDIVWAVRGDALDSGALRLTGKAEQLTSGFEHPLVALSSFVLEKPSSLVPPPLAWPLPLELRQALLERDVRLIHVIDLAQFRVSHNGARVVEIRLDARGALCQPCFKIRRADGLLAFASMRFVEEVIHGFATINSAVRVMLSGVHDIDDSAMELGGIDPAEARRALGPLIDELLEPAELAQS